MKVLIDTNVVVDALMGREPFFEKSDQVLKICGDGAAEGYLAAHSVTDAFYILRKHFSVAERREIFLELLEILLVEQVDAEKLKAALKDDSFSDFEDCLQLECATAVGVDYIITRNVKDFASGSIPCLTPDDFCRMMEAS